MKELIFIMLFLCFLALLDINDTIVEVNLTPEERTQLAEQAELKAKSKELALEIKIKKNEENTSRLLSLSWDEVGGEEKPEWLALQLINSSLAHIVFPVIFIVWIFVFMLSAFNKGRNGY